MDDITKLSPEEQGAIFLENVSKLSQDDQNAFHDLIFWIAYDRPDDDEPLTMERMDKLLTEIRLENIRRRLGGRTGVILQFPKTKKEE